MSRNDTRAPAWGPTIRETVRNVIACDIAKEYGEPTAGDYAIADQAIAALMQAGLEVRRVPIEPEVSNAH